jgi:mRNA interferase MazF
MRFGIMFEQGDIVLIPVPFSNLISIKKRPILVLSNNEHNKTNRDMIVIAITSNLEQRGVKISNDNLSDGFLPKTSIIKVDKIYTLDAGIAIKKIGKVNETVLANVFNEFVKLISPKNNPSG